MRNEASGIVPYDTRLERPDEELSLLTASRSTAWRSAKLSPLLESSYIEHGV